MELRDQRVGQSFAWVNCMSGVRSTSIIELNTDTVYNVIISERYHKFTNINNVLEVKYKYTKTKYQLFIQQKTHTQLCLYIANHVI